MFVTIPTHTNAAGSRGIPRRVLLLGHLEAEPIGEAEETGERNATADEPAV
jgi:hypothetical protein